MLGKRGMGSTNQSLHRMKEAVTRTRAIINELNFTYRRLMRLLPALRRRADGGPLGRVLEAQHRMDETIAERLVQVATADGEPPGPCVCDDANEVVDNVYHVDRAASTREARASAIVHALMAVRTFLIRTWGRLIANVSPENQPALLEGARALQAREAVLHRELVSLSHTIEAGPGEGHPDPYEKRSGGSERPKARRDRP